MPGFLYAHPGSLAIGSKGNAHRMRVFVHSKFPTRRIDDGSTGTFDFALHTNCPLHDSRAAFIRSPLKRCRFMQQPRGNVFVVEDDASLGHAMARSLLAAGYEARLFEDAKALLSCKSIHEADCFVLDIYLPGLSGFEIHDELRANGFNAPVAFITAQDDALHQRMAREHGATAYLIKPFSNVELIAAVSSAVGHHKQY
jgi:CheY-like chemotaxis protein